MRLYYMLFLITLSVANSAMAQRVKSIFETAAQQSIRSVAMVRISDGKLLYEEMANQSLIPASITKLATALCALELFGVNHSFETEFYYTGVKRRGVITGDLIIKGGGDPLLTNEKLWQMAADFHHMGIETVKGNLIIDNDHFDGNLRDQSRVGQRHQSSHAYDAPISAFGVNFNTFPIAIYPSDDKAKAYVNIDPYQIADIKIENHVQTTKGNRTKVNAIRKTTNDQTTIKVVGQIGELAPLKKIYRSVGSPTKIAANTIRQFLKNRGITILGNDQEGQTPETAQKLYTIQGEPLKRIINGLNKYSNNYIADMLTKNMGAHFYSKNFNERNLQPGSLITGSKVIEKHLMRNVRMEGDFTIKNGSGLDTTNQLSAKQIVTILQYAARNMMIFPELLSSLPIAQIDGTLKNRFIKSEKSFSGNLRAKTGTLTSPVSVASLAGYFYHPAHGLIAFAIIENGIAGRSQPSIFNLQRSHEQALQRIWTRLDKNKT